MARFRRKKVAVTASLNGKVKVRRKWRLAGSLVVLAMAGSLLVVRFTPKQTLTTAVASAFNALQAGDRVLEERDIAYGKDPRQRLDIYRPASSAPSKAVVIFFYGGGWKSGDRAMYRFAGRALAAKGIATVIPDYRLYPEVRFPAFVEDGALAYVWVARHFGGGTPVILMGHSAGAHIAALLAYDEHYIQTAARPDESRPAGFVGLSGPYAFDPTKNSGTAEIFKTANTADETRPARLVKAGAPPALLFHGTNDGVVGVWNAREFTSTLTREQVAVRKVELDGLGHAGPLLAMAWPFRWRAPVLAETVKFVAETASLHPPKSPSRENAPLENR